MILVEVELWALQWRNSSVPSQCRSSLNAAKWIERPDPPEQEISQELGGAPPKHLHRHLESPEACDWGRKMWDIKACQVISTIASDTPYYQLTTTQYSTTMSLKEGLYNIRFVPSGINPPFLGGLYATATEFGEPILAEAEGPDTPGQVVSTISNPKGNLSSQL